MKEVSEFLVMLPAGEPAEGIGDRLLEHLGAAFPYFTFRLMEDGPLADPDGFVVIPLMGTKGEGDAVYLCKPIEPDVIPAIMGELESFAAAKVH